MKKILVLIIIGLIGFIGYLFYPKEPEFVKITNIGLKDVFSGKLRTELEFTNPNKLGLEVVSQDIEVFISDKKLGEVHQKTSTIIEPGENFTLPLEIEFDSKEVFGKTGFGKNLWRSFVDDNLVAQFSGTLTVKVLGLSIPVPIEYEEKLMDRSSGTTEE